MSARVLCVAEKPSIAKAIANALGGGSVRSTPSGAPYIYNYEISYNSPVWRACEMTVTSVVGHLTDIEFLPPFDKFDSEAVQLFSAPIKTKVPDSSVKIADNIAKLSKKSTHLYIWTDCDREGEHIGNEVAEVARRANSRISVFRAHFNNTEPSHLRQAAGRPRELDMNAVEAVNVRRELDLRTGFALTRLQTELYRRTFGGAFLKRAVQYGSCQFPTLGFVVERYLRVINHIPEKFWYIDAAARASPQSIKLSWDRGRATDHLVALSHYERALESGNGQFKVNKVTVKPTSRYRPLPLTTVTLQKKASAYLKISAKQIMDVAERLYNEGFVSYPRTETDVFDKAIDLQGILSKQTTNATPWSQYARDLQNGKFVEPRNGGHNDKAHPPIHPVQGATPDALGGTSSVKWKIYEYITRSFLACCSNDAKGESTTINLQYGDETFTVSGDRIRELNFLEVYPYQKWNSKLLPDWKVGDTVPCSSFHLKESETAPPKLLTEAELISRMDSSGIGTDATMADHITKIVDRVYVTKKGEYYEPTPLGIALVMSYETIGLNLSLTKPLLRRETELEVSAVANGQKRKTDVLGQLVAKYEKVFKQTQSRRADLMTEARKHIQSSLESIDYSTISSASTQEGQTQRRRGPPGRQAGGATGRQASRQNGRQRSRTQSMHANEVPIIEDTVL